MVKDSAKNSLKEIQNVYSGPEGKLWEMVMGEQIHVGGYAESMVLAQKAGIKKGDRVLDLCSALGGGLRFLVKNFGVQGFGVDGTENMVNEARKRAADENLGDRIEFRLADVQDVPWPDETFDVVWGEDAWCYVADKERLISEAARLLRKGGTLAFSDWIEGSQGLTDAEAERICDNSLGMTFPYMESQKGYERLIAKYGLELVSSEDLNDHFAEMIDLYIKIVTKQLLYDALRIVGDNMEFFQAKGAEMAFWLEMAKAKKFSRGRWIARKG
jgi:ubiquinone/menaquinone biosynthesis C-methylase UbiE